MEEVVADAPAALPLAPVLLVAPVDVPCWLDKEVAIAASTGSDSSKDLSGAELNG